MLIRILSVIALAATTSLSVVVPSTGQPPVGWTVIDPPRTTVEWKCANYAREEWAVTEDSPHNIRIAPYEYTGQVTLDLPDGELVGTNRGEFGGMLEWVGRDAARRVIVPNVNPVVLMRRGADVFVASGLSHMGREHGEIIKLRRSLDGVWHISKVMDLAEAPNAGARIDDSTWVLLTTRGLTRVDLARLTGKQVYRNKNWWMLYGNSISRHAGAWFIGARRAVIWLTPDNGSYSEEWLVPDHCRNLVEPGCDCSS